MLLAVDWGSSHCRLALIQRTDGHVLAERQLAYGVLTHQPLDAPTLLRTYAADWLAQASIVVLGGMIASEAGWHFVPHQPCPAGLATQAAGALLLPAALSAELTQANIWLCAGLRASSVASSAADLVAGASAERANDVDQHRLNQATTQPLTLPATPRITQRMRGEELQILGCGQQEGWVCLPGTHSKWAWLRDGQVQHFSSYLTGELFAQSLQLPSLRALLARSREASAAGGETSFCAPSFSAGVQLAQQIPGLSQLWFAARCLLLEQQNRDLADDVQWQARSLLSGLVIGDELRQQLPVLRAGEGLPVMLLADGQLQQCYQLAFAQLGIGYQHQPSQASCWRGLWLLSQQLAKREVQHA